MSSSSRRGLFQWLINLTCLLMLCTRNITFAETVSKQYQSTDVEVTFGDLSTLAVDAGEVIRSIEVDLVNPDTFLIGGVTTIQTVTSTTNTVLVGELGTSGFSNGVGSAVRLNQAYVYQLSTDTVLFCDNRNHCVRKLNRADNSVEDFVGTCGSGGNVDGVGTAAKLYYPGYLIQDKFDPNLIYVSEYQTAGAIRLINIDTRNATSFYTMSVSSFGVFSFRRDSYYQDSLLIGTEKRLYRLDMTNKTMYYITGTSALAHADGVLTSSSFYYLLDVFVIYKDLYLIADNYNRRLRLVDVNKDQVQSICSGSSGDADGSFTNCSFIELQSVAFTNNNLYITDRNHIRVLPLQVTLDPSLTTQVTTPATTQEPSQPQVTTPATTQEPSQPQVTPSTTTVKLTTTPLTTGVWSSLSSSDSVATSFLTSMKPPSTSETIGDLTLSQTTTTSASATLQETTADPTVSSTSSFSSPGTTGNTIDQGTVCSSSAMDDTTAICFNGCFGILTENNISLGCLESLSLQDYGFGKITDCDAATKVGQCINHDNGNGEVENCVRCCTDRARCNGDFKVRCDYILDDTDCSGSSKIAACFFLFFALQLLLQLQA